MKRRDFLWSGALVFPAVAAAQTMRYTDLGRPLDEPAGVITPAETPPWKVDQAGYRPLARKLAMLTLPKPSARFALTAAGGTQPLFAGLLSPHRWDADSGDWTQVADFTGFSRSGRYQLQTEGAAPSLAFEIGPSVSEPIFRLAARFFYGQRCGCAVAMGAGMAAYHHPTCHLKAAFHPSSGRSGPVHNRGGWHDAGDYGRYVVNGGISTATLMWAAELFPAAARQHLDLPESGGNAPDLLREARWNLEWMLSLQDRDGGVWHKQTSTVFAPFVMPQDDGMTSYVIGAGIAPYKTTAATADLAAVAAIASRLWRPYDDAFAARCQTAALLAWRWLGRVPDLAFRNPPGIFTGEYGDGHLEDERLWAAAEIWRATGDPECHAYFRAHYAEFAARLPRITPPSWGRVAALGLWSYALAAGDARREPDANIVAVIQSASVAAADGIVARAAANGYRVALHSDQYVWGSNSIAANAAMQLLVAARFHPAAEYAATALETLHYLLGRNTFSLCFLTRGGSRAVQRPHHRPSVADGLREPWPGMLAGGPNRQRNDAAMRKYLPAELPPARNYIDNHAAYSCNEVAINWNAPLVFLLAANLDS
ncbi:MAG: glycoside hydrolase family 9 protein [Terriglobales bacterium]